MSQQPAPALDAHAQQEQISTIVTAMQIELPAEFQDPGDEQSEGDVIDDGTDSTPGDLPRLSPRSLELAKLRRHDHVVGQKHLQQQRLQVESITVRKQPVNEWGEYRIDKYGRVRTDSFVPDSMLDSPSHSHAQVSAPPVPQFQATTTSINQAMLARKLLREKKWAEMIDNWAHVKQEVLKRRVRKGIPSSMRGVVWPLILHLDKAKAQFPPRYYYDLLAKPVNEQHEVQIRKDLPRLMQDNIMFRSPEAGSRTVMCTGQAALYNILKAYSVHDPEVGYVQGMDSIAAPALLYFPEEITFWFLERLLNDPRYNLRLVYTDGFPLARKYVYIHEQLVKHFFPQLYDVMEEQGIQHSGYAFRWYTMRYAQFAPELSYRILDVYLYEGDKILYRVALALLHYYSKQLLADPESMMENLMKIEADITTHALQDGDTIMEAALKVSLRTKDIQRLSAEYDRQLLNEAGSL